MRKPCISFFHLLTIYDFDDKIELHQYYSFRVIKMKKSILSLLLVAAIFTGCLPLRVDAEGDVLFSERFESEIAEAVGETDAPGLEAVADSCLENGEEPEETPAFEIGGVALEAWDGLSDGEDGIANHSVGELSQEDNDLDGDLPDKAVKTIHFETSTLTLGVGEKSDRLCRLFDENGVEYTGSVTYSSNKKKYVTVDANGTVKGIKKGSATITAKLPDGNAVTCKVTVKKAPTKITAKPKSATLGTGESIALGYALPGGMAGSVTFTSSAPDVVTVDAAGNAEAKAVGSATITLKTYNGKKAKVTVDVKAAPDSVAFEENGISIGVGQKYPLKAAVNEGASSALTYTVEDESVASISDGTLTGLKVGETTVSVETFNGKADSRTVVVKTAPTSVSLPFNKLTLGEGDTYTLEPDVGDAAESFTFSSSNKKYVCVDADGNLKAVKAGNATVTVKTYNGKSIKLKVTVKKAPSSIKVKFASRKLGVGESFKLGYSLSPSNAYSEVSYAVEGSNPGILAVDEVSGDITALAPGQADVVLRTYNGKSATCSVTVYPAPTYVEAGVESIDLSVKEEWNLEPVLTEGSYSALSYESSNPAVATVSTSGVIKGKAKGSAVITVKTFLPEVCAKVNVSVWVAPSSVRFESKTKTVNIGEGFNLNPIIPAGSRTTFTYKSSNKALATVDAYGDVTPLARGKVKLTATTHNGKKATLTLTIYDPSYPEALKLTGTVPVLEMGDHWQVTYQVTPETANAELTWSSSNPNAVTVDQQGMLKAVGYGYSTITAVSARNKSLKLKLTVGVQSDDYVITIPARTTGISGISANLRKINAIRDCALREIDRLHAGGEISSADANKRKTYINNIFSNYAFPWMTPKKQLYWNAANSENGAKDFKPGVVYYGMPYISGSGPYRAYTASSAIAKDYYMDSGEGYYLLNKTNYNSRYYYGNDCSGLVSAAIWGMNNGAKSSYRTSEIAVKSEYKTVSFDSLRPGDLICKAYAHVVMFLYYTNPEKTKIMIIQNGGSEKAINTVNCVVMNVSSYKNSGYSVRRVASLG